MAKTGTGELGILSVDLEDWFHLPENRPTPPRSEWPELDSRAERTAARLLDLFAEADVRATFFVVGWVAWRNPRIVRLIAEAGHELACHSFWHLPLSSHDRASFVADLRASKSLLEDLSAQPVRGYRAPGGVREREDAWAFEVLIAHGLTYDASLRSYAPSGGGLHSPFKGPHLVQCPSGLLVELPVSTTGFGRMRMRFADGRSLRLLPARAIQAMARAERARGRPIHLHLRPRDFDPKQPQPKLSPFGRLKHYSGVGGTLPKLKELLAGLDLLPAGAWIRRHHELIAHKVYDIRRIASRPVRKREPKRVPPMPLDLEGEGREDAAGA